MKKAIVFFTAHPARFFLLAALLWGGFMCFLNYKDGADFSWHDLLVEANGMVFDLLVFGVLLSIYERLREKRDKIERLHEEIDDYRGWKEEEATYRILGIIRRLTDLGEENINLTKCFLQKAKLIKANLKMASIREANLKEANLQWANLWRANLSETNLRKANLQWADLQWADLREADLRNADFRGADLDNADLRGADIRSADLQRASLKDTKLDEVIVFIGWFDYLETWEIHSIEEIKAKYLIDENGVLREKQ